VKALRISVFCQAAFSPPKGERRFSFCLTGGLWILTRTDFSSKDDILSTAIGFYFVGKAFFVGPMLWLAAEKICPKPDDK